jgi:serine/threonine protein kinase
MGTVYRALDPTIGRTVAIKAIRLTDFADPAERQRVRDRLLQEARSAGLLSHPNIITIYDVIEEEGSAFIVMEYVQGPSLGDMLRAGNLPESGVMLRYFGQIADALDYAHRKGVIHRDIKSANILISSEHDRQGLAKISDFGISKFISQDTTHSGTMIGTPNYMAPEQIQGLPLDGRSDQFSFAVVVYEMLTGTKPFGAESLATLFYQVCKQNPTPPHELNSSLTSQVDEVIARALAKNPEGRFPSCGEFVHALATALDSSGAWQAPASTDGDARTLTSVAAAVGISEPATSSIRSTLNPRDREEPLASQPTPERPPELELPVLPRRARFDEARQGGDRRERRHPARSNRALLALVAAAIIAAVVFLVARFSTREPSAPVAASSAPRSSKPTSPPATETTGTAPAPAPVAAPAEPRPSEPVPKLGDARGTRTASGENPAPSVSVPIPVSVTTQPPGAQVTIDNRSETSCHSPCNTVLTPGRHTLTAELKGFDIARRIFTVPEDRQLTVMMSQSMGVLLVTTEPSGSTVTVDGKQYGATPLTVRLPAGSHQLLVTNGAGRHEESVQIENDQFTTRSFRWQ